MINRLLIRIKVAQLVYACQQSGERMYADQKLLEAVEASQSLYDYLLALIVKLTEYRATQIETAKNKWLPTEQDLNPNVRFANNRIAALIRDTTDVVGTCQQDGLMSDFDTELYRSLMEAIEQNPTYQHYNSQPEEPTFADDKALWIDLLNTVIPQCPALDEVLEDRNIYWNDDLTTILQAVVRTVRSLSPRTEMLEAVTSFRNEEDRLFASDLYHFALDEYYDNVRLINSVASNWESDRMALMDKVIMACALSEIRHFADIATAISINEYVELAKHYCSPRSASFINGVLDRVSKQWLREGVIVRK